jgi:hypothetical protein
MAHIIRLADHTISDDAILQALGMDPPAPDPDSVALAHGETMQDRIALKLIRYRAMRVAARRKALALV